MEGELMDGISDLHDPILEHILSFLPTKHAVRTSVLSKRWKDLWISHPYVSFSDKDLTGHTTGLEHMSISDQLNRTREFIKFVDKVLLHRHDRARIKKLQLSCRQGLQESVFAKWLGAVMKDGLEELDLNFGRFCENPMSCLIPCNSLVTLKLNFGALSGHRFPTNFYFPSLKSMHLNGFMLADNFPDQLLKCRNLEDLFLYYFMFDIPSREPIAKGHDRKRVLPNLRNAQIGCSFAFRGNDNARLFLKKLITVISNAKVLDLSLSISEYLYLEPTIPDELPEFKNLKHLKLFLQAYQVGVLNYFFEKAPNLESLHIDRPFNYGVHDILMLEQLRTNCSRAPLKVIRMMHSIPGRPQLELVRLFLESAGFLEKITIVLEDELEAENPFMHCLYGLFELPRPSKSCVLEVKCDNGRQTFTFCN